MHLFPNGQNIQFAPPLNGPTAPARGFDLRSLVEEPRERPIDAGALQALKQLAPQMNRKERRTRLKELKTRAKAETSELARREIEKQNKEKTRG